MFEVIRAILSYNQQHIKQEQILYKNFLRRLSLLCFKSAETLQNEERYHAPKKISWKQHTKRIACILIIVSVSNRRRSSLTVKTRLE